MTSPYRYDEQHSPPEPERASEVAITRFEHVFEVDPRLMQRWVLQQEFPNWDTLRIMNSRHDHLDWMHAHFATKIVQGSEILGELDEPEADDRSETPAAGPTREVPT
jgi:hypothetical protein